MVVGADYKILPKLVIGIAGGYEYSNLDPRFVSGLGSANSGYGVLFATYGGSSGLYAETIGAVGYTAYDIQRDVLGTSAHGYPDGWDASVGGTLGYLVKLTDNVGIAPFGKIFYDHLWRSGASETGSIAGLDVKHGSADSLQTVVGGQLVITFDLGSIRLNNEYGPVTDMSTFRPSTPWPAASWMEALIRLLPAVHVSIRTALSAGLVPMPKLRAVGQ